MLDQIVSITEKLENKKILVTVRRLLNVLFISNITSVIFEKLYYKYSFISLTDYSKIFEFLIKGQYIIPLSIFSLLWLITWIVGYFGFQMYHLNIIKGYKKKISEISFTEEKLNTVKSDLESNLPYKINKRWYLSLYQEIKKNISSQMWSKMTRSLDNLKEAIIHNFILILRGFLSTLFLFISVPEFNALLFIICVIVLLLFTFLMSWGFRVFEIVPFLFQKASFEFEKMIKKENESKIA